MCTRLTPFILSILLFAAPSLSAQDYKATEARADSLLRAGKVADAIPLYHAILQEVPQDQHNNYNLACSYALLNLRDSAFHFLHIALERDTSVRALGDPDFIYLIEDERWAGIEEKQVEKVEAKYGKYEKPELAKELWKMRLTDQAYYYHISIADEALGRRNPVTTALWQKKLAINEANQKRIVEIIEEHGWPTESMVKGSAAQAAFLVIQHADLELQKKYIGQLKEACDQGEASCSGYALMYDRIEVREDRPQLYGSQVRLNQETGEYEPFPIKDPEYVNKRRAEVGLGPIQGYLANWDIEWEVEQKE